MQTTRRHILATLPALATCAGLGGVAATSLLAARPALAATAGFDFTPPVGRFIYTITRNGEPIGTQRLDFQVENDRALMVVTDVEIDVRILGLSFYRFTQHIEERWQDGELAAISSQTDDDGEKRLVDLKREGDRLKGRYNEKARDVPGDIIPSTLWHPESINQKVVLDTVRARQHQVSVADKGRVALVLPVGQEDARRYGFTGELNRDVWYGGDKTILAAEMTAKDGSIIRQQLLDRPA